MGDYPVCGATLGQDRQCSRLLEEVGTCSERVLNLPMLHRDYIATAKHSKHSRFNIQFLHHVLNRSVILFKMFTPTLCRLIATWHHIDCFVLNAGV